jgi:3-hydroxybutyryl-CoA dehydrogenase
MAQRFPQVAVIGLGTIGTCLAALLARHGHHVTAVEADDASLERARGGLGAGSGITLTTRPTDIASADLVIEAVPERLETKRAVLTAAHELCSPRTVLATTTTALPVSRIAADCGRRERTVGLHLFPFSPDAEGTAVEVAAAPRTRAEVAADIHDLLRGLGRVPVAVPDTPGFVGGALAMAYLNDAVTMHERRYAPRHSIDAAMTLGCGLPSGPLARLDEIGLDTAHLTLEALYERTGDRRYVPAQALTHMVAAGLHGRKTGRGFYVHDGHDRGEAAPAEALGAARPVRRVGVVGSGTMATGIAEVCARAGHTTVLAARTELKAKEALTSVERSLERAVRRGKATTELLTATMERLTGAGAFDALADCDIVVEAVAEDLAVKRDVFTRLDRVCREGAVLATVTSSLPVIECAMATSRPRDVVGMHFFNPAPVMRLVEVVGTVLSAEDAVATARALATAVGKRPVACPDRAGFIVNALLFPYLNRAIEMLQDGAVSAENIDTVMARGHGYPMGPLLLLDVIGLDVSLAIQRTLHHAHRDPALAPAARLEQLVEAGHLGRKTGRGFLDHTRK